MIRSTPPAEALAGHPVHCATALLRHALLSSPSPAPDPAEIWDDARFRIDPAPADLAHGPVSITFPALMPFPRVCQPPVTYAPDGGAANASLEEASEGDEMLDRATQMQLQKLAQAFYRRQRQASLLVAASITLAVVLTFAGLFLLFTMTGADSEPRRDAMSKEGTHSARRAELAPPFLASVRVYANRSAKTAPLLIRAKADATTPPLEKIAFGTDVILAAPKRPLALGALLPVGSARYLLLRGLPEQAQLSAGRRTGVRTWMVKRVDVPNLTLRLGHGASGDYPVDVYLLEASDGLQARRRLILRVNDTPQVFDGGLSLGWSMPVPDLSQKTFPAAASTGISKLEADAVRDRAQTLFARGDSPPRGTYSATWRLGARGTPPMSSRSPTTRKFSPRPGSRTSRPMPTKRAPGTNMPRKPAMSAPHSACRCSLDHVPAPELRQHPFRQRFRIGALCFERQLGLLRRFVA